MLTISSFLWLLSQARLVGDSTPEETTIPAEVNSFYQEAFDEFMAMDADDRTVCRLGFDWIIAAAEPLLENDLSSAIQVCLATEGVHIAEEVDTDRLRYIWPSVLTLDVSDGSRSVWKLSHTSIARYISEEAEIGWTRRTAESRILMACVRLLLNIFNKMDSAQVKRWNAYARRHWITHVLRVDSDRIDEQLAVLLKDFFGSPFTGSPYYQTWLQDIAADLRATSSHPTDRILAYLKDKPPIVAMCCTSMISFLSAWMEEANLQVPGDSPLLSDIVSCSRFDDRSIMIGQKLIEMGMDVNQPTGPGARTALADAIEQGETEWVELFLAKGARVDNEDIHIGKAMVAAAENQRGRILELLIRSGASPDAKPGLYGETSVLTEAAKAANIEIVEMLVASGADINMRLPGTYVSALAAAASNPDAAAVVQLLIDYNADIDIQGGKCGSALAQACASGGLDAAKCFVSAGVDVNQVLLAGEYGTALAAAAYHNSIECLIYLLEVGAEVDPHIPSGRFGSALVAAASGGAVECLRTLMRAGAEVNQLIHTGKYGSGLAAAAAAGSLPCLKLLLEAGAEVNYHVPGGLSGSALAAAAANGKLDCLQVLLESGADVNAEFDSKWENNVLADAIKGGDLRCVQALLQAGAYVDQQLPWNGYGSILGVAVRSEKLELLWAILDAGANPNLLHQSPSTIYGSPLEVAAGLCQANCMRALIRAGADVNQKGKIGPFGTPLIATVISDKHWPASLPCVEILVKAGADVNLRVETRKDGSRFGTALIAASFLGMIRHVRYLVQAGADVSLRLDGSRFHTALEAAMAPVSEEERTFFKRILGPFIVISKKGMVAEKEEVVELLKANGAS